MSTVADEKRGTLMLVFVMSLSILMYGAIIFFLAGTQSWEEDLARPASLRAVAWLLALALLAIAAWRVPQLPAGTGTSREDFLPVPEFRGRIFVAVLLADSAAVVGLVLAFLSRRPGDFAVPAGAALALIGLQVVPTTLRYFALLEKAERAEQGGHRFPKSLDPG